MKILRVGAILSGYCNGAFGESYNEKRVEAIGADWVVARESDDPLFFKGDPESLIQFIDSQSRNDIYYDREE